jgi:hypothetical protein
MRALPAVIAFFMLSGFAGCSNTVTEYRLESYGRVTRAERLTPDESWKRTEDRRIEAEVAGRKQRRGRQAGGSTGSGLTPTFAAIPDLLLGSQPNLRTATKWSHTSNGIGRHAGFRYMIRPNHTSEVVRQGFE